MSSKDIGVIILAGGFGTRLKNVIGNIPKPLALVHGKPFLFWLVTYLKSQGLQNFFLSTHYQSQLIEEYIKQAFPADNICCIKEPAPLGTGGGVLNVINQIKYKNYSSYLILNGDTLVLSDLKKLFSALNNEVSGVVLAVEVTDAQRYGRIFSDANSMLTAFSEKIPGSGYINSGVWLFSSQVLEAYLPNDRAISLETDLIPNILAKKIFKIKVVGVESPFIDIGTETSLVEGAEFVSNNIQLFEK